MNSLLIDKAPICKTIEQVSAYLDGCSCHSINCINWHSAFPYCPNVSFAISYTDNALYLKYWVNEDCFIAAKTETNDNVYQDSCVEFFVAFDNEGYYNFEWNGIGTALVGYGKDRFNRTRLNKEIIEKIDIISSLPIVAVTEEMGNVEWSLTIAIPFELFIYHTISDLSGKSFNANFYKCGDSLSKRHYLSCSPIGTPKPDFHQPLYFLKVICNN